MLHVVWLMVYAGCSIVHCVCLMPYVACPIVYCVSVMGAMRIVYVHGVCGVRVCCVCDSVCLTV